MIKICENRLVGKAPGNQNYGVEFDLVQPGRAFGWPAFIAHRRAGGTGTGLSLDGSETGL
jgi:hypothetical protein